MPMPKVDPKLTRRLATHKGNVQAVFTLRSSGKPLEAQQTEDFVRSILSRAEQSSATKAKRVQVFRNLQSFAVEAPAEFISSVLNEDEVDSASLNSQD